MVVAVRNYLPLGILVAVAVAFVLGAFLPVQAHAQPESMSPAQPLATSDGTSIDQGIAYALMLLALVLTYIIHSADLSISFST
ncbi:arabinogalactan peptide 22-like [Momordica charantia]|uniref:Arabinogalactan peptide 22-like n=1 Tax=Momordica charantia TaxID=3673 RepID=A0A6J1CXM0_MOMCH|nr:arabinogalactan peptide 22-like [Momordica charantia]